MNRHVDGLENVTVMTTALVVRLEQEFSIDMEELRRVGWASASAELPRDEFDQDSFYLVVRQSRRPCAMVRITVGPKSPLLAWSGGCAPLPSNPTVAELTRAVVAPPVRRLGLYRLAMLETMLRLETLEVSVATAAIELEFPGRSFLRQLGFFDVGTPLLVDDRPRQGTLVQCIRLNLGPEKYAQWLALREYQLAHLLEHGYRVDSDLA